ncbi:MAG TPA: hypothetical protein VD993_18860 [Chitinophagaceae bacterium]|nr:hypothetical protein [Chitinophagaceae bacterium]
MKQLAIVLLLFGTFACNNEPSQQSDWKAVQNLQPPRETPGGQLKVTGTVRFKDYPSPTLQPREPQGINPKIFMLDIVPGADPNGSNTISLTLTKTLMTEDELTSVEIYNKGEKIAEMKIEKVH